MMTAYLDNNIFVDIENGLLTREELISNVDSRIDDFFYSAAHLQEAYEIKGSTPEQTSSRLLNRFETISRITNNNYLFHELPSNKIYKLKEDPQVVYGAITDVSFAQNAIKSMLGGGNEEQKETIRQQLTIDPIKLNNYSSTEVISHLNERLELFGGYSIVGLLDKAIELHPHGSEFGLHNKFAGIFEFLDMLGYWKDKYNEKSNYARLWDSNHSYFSSVCDYFISNDKRTRNKAKVVFDMFGISTRVVSSKGIS